MGVPNFKSQIPSPKFGTSITSTGLSTYLDNFILPLYPDIVCSEFLKPLSLSRISLFQPKHAETTFKTSKKTPCIILISSCHLPYLPFFIESESWTIICKIEIFPETWGLPLTVVFVVMAYTVLAAVFYSNDS